jgi:hypothetical protein
MSWPTRLTLAAAAGLVAACTLSTPFEPAAHRGEEGYRVERTEQDHFHIAFNGNSSTSRRQVEDYLAYLAAQVTLRNGADYFVLANDRTERTTSYAYLDSYRDPSLQCCHWRGVTYHEYEASADIVIRQGVVPQDDPAAHDARAIVEELTPLIKRGRRGVY